MASRIVSWGGNEHIVSPTLLKTPSIVSVDSILRDTSPVVQGTPPAQSGAMNMASQVIEPSRTRTSTSTSTYPGADAADGSFVRHPKYFFNDGNVAFLVDYTLYCVHRYFFSRDSIYFSTRFTQLNIHDHVALPTIISFGDIERKDFDAFLSVLYPENFEENDLCYEEWKSVLHLSTRWGFSSIRKLALRSIEPPTPHDRLLLARAYLVDDWVVPALSALCERTTPLTLSEARQMNIEDVVLVSTVREHIRGRTIQVDAAEIPLRVEAEQLVALGHRISSSSSRESEDVTPMAGAWHSRTRRENAEAEARAKAQKAMRQRLDAKVKAEEDAENEAKGEETAKAKEAADREAQAKAAREAKVIADAEAKATAEKAEKEADTRAATAKAESAVVEEKKKERQRKRAEKVKEAELQRAKAAEELVAKQRAADKAARLAASSPASSPMSSQPPGGGWLFSKMSQAVVSAIVPPGQPDDPSSPSRPAATSSADLFSRRPIKSLSSPGTELGPRNPSVMRQSTTSSTSQETSTSSLQTTDSATVGPDNAGEIGAPSSEGDAAAAAKSDNPDPEAVAKEPTALSGADDGHTTGEGPTAPQGEDAKSGRPPKLTLPMDRVRQLSTAIKMFSSSVETPADEAGSPAVEVEEEGGADELGTPSKSKRKKDKSKKKKGEKNCPRPASGATVNNVDNPIEQETKPVTSNPVDVPGGEGLLVEKADSSGEDSAVFVDAPLAETEVEKAADATASDVDKWNDWADGREVLHN